MTEQEIILLTKIKRKMFWSAVFVWFFPIVSIILDVMAILDLYKLQDNDTFKINGTFKLIHAILMAFSWFWLIGLGTSIYCWLAFRAKINEAKNASYAN